MVRLRTSDKRVQRGSSGGDIFAPPDSTKAFMGKWHGRIRKPSFWLSLRSVRFPYKRFSCYANIAL